MLGVHGEAEEEHVHHDLKDGQEAVGHQPGEQADDEQGQHPHRVVPLVVERQYADERSAGDDQYLDTHTHARTDRWRETREGKRERDKDIEKDRDRLNCISMLVKYTQNELTNNPKMASLYGRLPFTGRGQSPPRC